MSELGPSPLAAGDRNLSVAEARAAIPRRWCPSPTSNAVPLLQALGRVLAADVVSPIDVPAHDNSAMDGYAFARRRAAADADTVLQVAGTVYAGAPFGGAVARASACAS
jgi:molybdopterin molybdotransferase